MYCGVYLYGYVGVWCVCCECHVTGMAYCVLQIQMTNRLLPPADHVSLLRGWLTEEPIKTTRHLTFDCST